VKPLPPMPPLPPLAEGRVFEGRCRRYLFDRDDLQSPRPPLDDAATSRRAPSKPLPNGWEHGLERRR